MQIHVDQNNPGRYIVNEAHVEGSARNHRRITAGLPPFTE
jgi:hypothetical protein